jgi:Arc/MetJ-type ribon-helix-helix transcriptional regulator
MARIDAKLPPELATLLEASGDSGLFRGKSDAARTAVRAYFERNPDAAINAVRALVTDDDDAPPLTVGDAVRLTGQPPSVFSEELLDVLEMNERERAGGESDGA